MQITTLGMDIAESVFRVRGIDSNETVVVRKHVRRGKLWRDRPERRKRTPRQQLLSVIVAVTQSSGNP
jgi:hypothetical protein